MRRLARRLLRAVLPVLNRLLHRLEITLWSGADQPLPHAPVLILGAPRSGTTLLFQVLTEALDFGYLSNLHCLFRGGPSFVERLFRNRRRDGGSSFSSRHGVVEGWSAPSECGGFWYRFFPRSPQYVPAHRFKNKRQLRAALRALLSASGRPVLFKNLHCALRLEPLALSVPEALYIFMTRSEVDNGHSLLEGRKNVNGNYEEWWSVEPPSIDSLRALRPEQQVIEQIRAINELALRQLREFHAGRFLTLTYDELASDPHGVVQRVAAFLEANGANPKRRPGAGIPESFPTSSKVKIDNDLYDRMVAYAAERQR